MSEYISRDEALNFEMEIEADPEDIQAISTGMSLMSEHIKSLPSINVVHCKDCRFLTPSAYMIKRGHCCRLNKIRSFDWFCADGRREEDDQH